ncbi:hypothetical protein GEMRC1_003385 [Eukaryota sp. GEM-RC1]
MNGLSLFPTPVQRCLSGTTRQFLAAINSKSVPFLLRINFQLASMLSPNNPPQSDFDHLCSTLACSNYPRLIAFLQNPPPFEELLLSYGWLVHGLDLLLSNPSKRKQDVLPIPVDLVQPSAIASSDNVMFIWSNFRKVGKTLKNLVSSTNIPKRLHFYHENYKYLRVIYLI